MQQQRRLEEEYDRFQQAQPAALTRREVEEIRALAAVRRSARGASARGSANRR
ncbi:MAG TPA: hypothetical protein VKU02_33345 [Gemmataceae bacterium]|nr:hypothetical protein [Gemmataceae bacterium]